MHSGISHPVTDMTDTHTQTVALYLRKKKNPSAFAGFMILFSFFYLITDNSVQYAAVQYCQPNNHT